jgi:hypothetical protein
MIQGRSLSAQLIAFLIASVTLTASLGCRDPNQPELHPVSGTVTLDGQPLANAAVMFLPRGSTLGNACLGYTDETGKYILAPERGGGEGAPEGEFAVIVSKTKEPPPGTPPGAAETDADQMLPSAYWDSAKTVLSAKVPKGGGTVNFDLKSNP